MRHLTAGALFVALMIAGPALAQPSGPRCNMTAFVIDQDPRGLNVRAGPSTGARLLQVVRNQNAAVAQLTGQSGTWFHISGLTDAETGATLFRGDGWVHASLLGISVANADPRLYARPARQSRALARLVPDLTQVTLIGCSGDWARVRSGRREGWLSRDGQCSNPLTTCV